MFGQVVQGIHLWKSQDYLFSIIKHMLDSSAPRYGKYLSLEFNIEIRPSVLPNIGFSGVL